MTPRAVACALLAAVVLYALLVLLFSVDERAVDVAEHAERYWNYYQTIWSNRDP